MVGADAARSQQRIGLTIAAIGGLFFTLDIPLLRLAQGDQWTLIVGRGAFFFAIITIWWLVYFRLRGIREPFINGGAGWIVVATNTVANLLFIAAITKTTAANLVFILALNPIFAAILSWFVLKEKLPVWTWVAMIIALFGVGIIVSDGLSTGTIVGDCMALVVAMCTAIGLTVVRKTGKNIVTSLGVGSLVSASFAFFVTLPYAFLQSEGGVQVVGGFFEGIATHVSTLIGNLSLAGWGWVALNGLIVMPIASAMIALAPRYIASAEVAMFFLFDPVLVPIWIWLIFSELPTQQSLIGGIIVIVTLIAHSIWRYASSEQKFPPPGSKPILLVKS